MKFAIIGCGYIAASYAEATPHHPELALIGAFDRDAERLRAFTSRWPCRAYASADDLLADPAVELVLNLTDPRSHSEVTRAALEAGKHVYSEKPLGMTGAQARALADLARARGLTLASAPCSVLSETAETVRAALCAGVIGDVRLVYANYDDGMIAPHLAPWSWRNAVGVPWPARDEFEVGCAYEHAGYPLSWLAAFFGPVERVASFAARLISDKGVAVTQMAPDFTVACLTYPGGIVARLTCGIVAPQDKSLTIVGDAGVLGVANMRNERSPVRYRRYASGGRLAAAVERRVDALRQRLGLPPAERGWTGWRRYPYVSPPPRWLEGRKPVDFMRGPSELAQAVREGRPCRLSAELGAHIAEVVEAIQAGAPAAGDRVIVSRFPPIVPRYDGPATQEPRPSRAGR